jgi:hypothetical protein
MRERDGGRPPIPPVWRRSRALLRGLPALFFWLAAGCEALVDGQLGQVHCMAEGQVGPPACPDGLTCKAGACVDTYWGSPCGVDTDCLTAEFCLDPQIFGGRGNKRCSRPCCASSDCSPDADSVCWVPPVGGGAFCMGATDVGRGAPGTRGPLATCSSGADCRSGLCPNGTCTDTCCSDTNCAPNGMCRVAGPPSADALGFWCGPALGTVSPGGPCTTDADCATGLCLDFGLKQLTCSMPCCRSSDCDAVQGIAARCVILTGARAGVRACVASPDVGVGTVGVACTKNADCRSGMCLQLGARLQCSDVCCSDESCGEGAPYVCRPANLGGAWSLRCEPK